MRINVGLPTGVTGVLFEEARARRRLEAWLAGELEDAGYSEVILPILDYFQPYEPLLTAATREELYRFVDRDGELLAVRGDFTPMLARLLAPRLHTLDLPLRLFYRGDVVRHQEVRPGGLREYYAMGAELLGAERESADEEVLALFVRLLSAAGVGPMRVVLGFAGALDELLKQSPQSAADCAAAIARRDRGAARLGGEALLEIVRDGVPQHPEALGHEAAAGLAELVELRDRLQEEHRESHAELVIDLAEFATNTLDPELAIAGSRWAYYDGIVFRAYQLESGLEVGRGGRYDLLFRALGAEVPAIGFSFGMDGLLLRSGAAGVES